MTRNVYEISPPRLQELLVRSVKNGDYLNRYALVRKRLMLFLGEVLINMLIAAGVCFRSVGLRWDLGWTKLGVNSAPEVRLKTQLTQTLEQCGLRRNRPQLLRTMGLKT